MDSKEGILGPSNLKLVGQSTGDNLDLLLGSEVGGGSLVGMSP